MANNGKIDINLNKGKGENGNPCIVCTIETDNPAFVGKFATLEFQEVVEVHDSRPVNLTKTLFRKKFVLLGTTHTVDIPLDAIKAYSYKGSMIDIKVMSKLTIDDKLIFDTSVSEEQQISIGTKPNVNNNSQAIVNPKDSFDFMANLRAIPPMSRLKVQVLGFVAAVFLGINTYVGYHDQFVVTEPTYLYSRVNSDGESQSPMVGAGGVDAGAAAFLWFLIYSELKKYMRFKFRPLPPKINRDTVLKVSDMVEGIARVDLNDITVNIVACNMECGQYKRGSGTKERTVSFSEPVRAVMLYSKRIDHIPKNMAVEEYLNDDISFRDMFAVLYPPNMPGSSHGVDVRWEVQLIHPLFVDHELVGDTSVFEYRDFLEA